MRFSEPVFESACEAAAIALKLDGATDSALSAYFRRRPELGKNDRETVAETVYKMLRRKRLIEHLGAGASVRMRALTCWAVLLGAKDSDLEGIARRSELAALAEARLRAREPLPLEVECDLPDWLLERLLRRFGEGELRALAAALLQSAPLDLRVNTMKSSRDEVLACFASQGLGAQRGPLSPVCVRVQGKPPIKYHPLFAKGALDIQDEGSQLLCFLVGARRSEMVADYCAGAGGKTLTLAMIMRSTGRVYAFDVSDKLLARLRKRLARSGLTNVHSQRIDAGNDARLERLRGKFDRVLVDAPCSGLGTLRRNPHLKWRQSPRTVSEFQASQRSILASAARLLKPGGRLVYATCSILDEENRDVVNDFREHHPQFRLVPAIKVLREERIALDTGEYLELWPHRHGTDAFFAAVLEHEG